MEDENKRCAGALNELVMVLGKLDWSATAIAMFSQLSTVMSFSDCSSLPSTPLSHTCRPHTHTQTLARARRYADTHTPTVTHTHTHIQNNTNAHTASVNQPIAQLCCTCRPVPRAARSASARRPRNSAAGRAPRDRCSRTAWEGGPDGGREGGPEHPHLPPPPAQPATVPSSRLLCLLPGRGSGPVQAMRRAASPGGCPSYIALSCTAPREPTHPLPSRPRPPRRRHPSGFCCSASAAPATGAAPAGPGPAAPGRHLGGL